MSDSYPTIQDSLSDIQKEFMGCVEMHLEPPEHFNRDYAVEAVYRCEEDAPEDLPGNGLRFTLSVEGESEDVVERKHTIEFLDPGTTKPRGWIRHRMKRVEALSGRYFWTESRFEVCAPGVPRGHALESEVEREVHFFVDKIRVLDRARKLVEV